MGNQGAIDAAVRAAAQPTEERLRGQIEMSTGRIVRVDMPADLTPIEILDVVAWCSTQLRLELAQHARRRPRLWTPGGG